MSPNELRLDQGLIWEDPPPTKYTGIFIKPSRYSWNLHGPWRNLVCHPSLPPPSTLCNHKYKKKKAYSIKICSGWVGGWGGGGGEEGEKKKKKRFQQEEKIRNKSKRPSTLHLQHGSRQRQRALNRAFQVGVIKKRYVAMVTKFCIPRYNNNATVKFCKSC